jgi:hypothetical protein
MKMKIIIILLAFVWNVSLLQESVNYEPTEVNFLRMGKIQVIDSVSTNALRIRPFHLEIIPPSCGVQFYRDGIIFLSHSKLEEKVPERHLSFGSVRTYTSPISDTVPGNYKPFDLNSTALFPSEATTFSGDFNTMYLSIIPEKSSSEKIFRAKYTSNGWKIEDTPLTFCNDNSIYSHPCLSADETFMVFSSDRSGTTGGLDLWITKKENEGWSNPKNLGKQINSVGNELFAALDSRNNLYFSSDGHPGKGGYDIFVAAYNGSGWDKPHNLPGSINTKDDELAYKINISDSKTAFYTSRARSGRPRTQLYIIDLNQGQPQMGTISLGDRILALAGISPAAPKEEEVPAPEITTVKKEIAASDKPVQPAQAEQVTKGKSPASDKARETSTSEVRKEVVPQPKTAATTPTSEGKKEAPAVSKPTPANPASEVKKDEVVYRVQIIANTKPVGSQNITVAGKSYKSFEYLYKGGYRTTIGEFSNLQEAMRLQSTCRQNGYSQAFVVAFKNNIRSTDPELFK